jgi:hypothetical protein
LIWNSAIEASVGSKTKTEDRYLGPYVVVRRTEYGAYIIREPDGAQHQTAYATFRLLPYISHSNPLLRDLSEDQQDSDSDTSESTNHPSVSPDDSSSSEEDN